MSLKGNVLCLMGVSIMAEGVMGVGDIGWAIAGVGDIGWGTTGGGIMGGGVTGRGQMRQSVFKQMIAAISKRRTPNKRYILLT